jgi:hypothetical protein
VTVIVVSVQQPRSPDVGQCASEAPLIESHAETVAELTHPWAEPRQQKPGVEPEPQSAGLPPLLLPEPPELPELPELPDEPPEPPEPPELPPSEPTVRYEPVHATADARAAVAASAAIHRWDVRNMVWLSPGRIGQCTRSPGGSNDRPGSIAVTRR